MYSNFKEQAIEYVKQAVQEDNAGNYVKAFPLYMNALEYFRTHLKYEKNPKIKEAITQKFTEYLRRAEEIRAVLDDGGGSGPTANGDAAVATRPKTKPKDGEGGGEDADQAKLRAGLTSAIITEKPNVKWNDVAGLESAKQALQEAVILPVKFPQFFTGKRRPWRAFLLYGPPGTGKSYLAKAVATEAESTFFSISSSDLVSKWMGESEKLVANLFQMARDNAPSIIFIDEIDSLCGQRGEGNESEASRRIKTELLVQMQGVGNNDQKVLVLAATNTPYALDQAIRRRFDKRIYIPLPDVKARQHMFKVHLGDTPHNLSESDFEDLARRTEGFSGSDIAVCVKDVLFEPVRKAQDAMHFYKTSEGMWLPCGPRHPGAIQTTLQDLAAKGLADKILPPPITRTDFDKVLARQRPTVSKADLEVHERFTFPPLKGSILHQLLHFGRIHDYHTDLAGESKTFRLLGPSRSYFYTVDPLVVEHVLRTNFAKYGKGFYNYHNLKDLLGDGIFAVDGEKWRHQRKLSSYEFSAKNLRDFSGDVFRKAAAKLAAAISNSARSNKAVDIQDLFMRSTMDSIFKVGFDVELDTLSGSSKEGKAFARAFDEASDLVLWRYADPSWMIKRLLNFGSEATLRKDIKIIDEFMYKLIYNKKELLSKQQNQAVGKQHDMLSRFLVEKENDSENMNDKYLRDIILNIIIAGRDTTAITLSWFFYMLCKHSSLQDQLAREVEDSTGADHCCTDMAGFTSTLTEAALSKMQFLHAALTETLRLHPAIPEDPKICFCDDTLPGCLDIKEGDMICYLPYSMGRMKFLWGEDAEDFRPERWLDENGAFQAENPFKFTAFQAGPRICLGKDFAYIQMKIVSAVLLHFFRFELKDESRNVRYKSSITLRIDGGLELLARHRQSVDTVG